MEGRKTETEREDGSCDGRNTNADKYEEDNTWQDGYETLASQGSTEMEMETDRRHRKRWR